MTQQTLQSLDLFQSDHSQQPNPTGKNMKIKRLRSTLALCMASVMTTAMAADISSGKNRAALCAGCHGLNGIGLSQEYPNLAGQKQTYLLKQLRAFKNGERKNPTMSAMVANLGDQDMQNLAAYFSSLSMASVQKPAAAAVLQDKASRREFPATTYITMKKSGSVENFPQLAQWQGGPNMLYDALTPNGKMLLATSPSSDAVYVFDTSSGRQLAVIPVGKAPKGVKISPDGMVAYVSNQGSADISVVDLQRLKVVDSIKTAKWPHNARFTRDGKLAYVTLQGGAGIGVIDTAARKMIRIIAIPGITGPHNLDLSGDEKTAFVRDFVHNVAVVDLVSGQVKKVIKVGNGHGGIDVTPDDRYAITAAIGDNFISVIDTKSLSVQNIEVGNGPHGVRASRDSRWIYVTLTRDNAIAVVNSATMKVEKKIPAGQFPFWIAVQGNS
jgi:YVTN family beta-propeller protein